VTDALSRGLSDIVIYNIIRICTGNRACSRGQGVREKKP
jgi:hypothetical protein